MIVIPASHPADTRGVVITGGGLAAQRAAETLRHEGYGGVIRIACAESRAPYDRPPLSKGILTNDVLEESLAYRPPTWYADNGVDLLLGTAARHLDLGERRLGLADGGALRYDRLLIATGGRPRTLAALTGYENVTVLRSLDDARVLRSVLANRPRLAVIGGGFIGLELAAAARAIDATVVLIEAGGFPLEAALGARLGAWFGRLHARHGVDVRARVSVDRAIGEPLVNALRLSDGSLVEVDHVVVGVGIAPEVGWLASCGLAGAAGVPVDAHGRTAAPGVFAAGDAAATLDPLTGRYVAGSHWEAAARQAQRAARLMVGRAPGPVPLTSFWSDQYGLRIQYIGDRRDADGMTVDGDVDAPRFRALFTRRGRAVAGLLVDRARDLPAVRQQIERGRR